MKFKRSEKYASIAFYAFITVFASALICLVFFKFSTISGIISKIIGVLTPITYGFVIAYLCNPLMKLFETKVFRLKEGKEKLRRVLSITATYIVVLALIALFFIMLIPQIIDSYKAFNTKIDDYIVSAKDFADNFSKKFKFLSKNGSLFDSFLSKSSGYIEMLANYVIEIAGGFVKGLTNLIIGLILSVYFLYSKEKLCAQIKKLLASVTSRKVYLNTVSLTRYTHQAFGGFITGKILDSLIIGILTLIVTALFGFDYYPLLAVVIGVTNIIPIFGPIIGAIPTAFIVFISQPNKLILFIVLVIIIQQIDGNIIGPKILGDSIGLGAMWVMISITIAGGLFGLTGMLIGLPAFAVIYTLVREQSEQRLKRKGLPSNTESYMNDPPYDDYLHKNIFIHKNEEIPENLKDIPEAPRDIAKKKIPLHLKLKAKADRKKNK